jgi:cytochrome o ubiquinol oxidase subunit IV
MHTMTITATIGLPCLDEGLCDRFRTVGDPHRHSLLAGDDRGAPQPAATGLVIMGFAAVQIVVHMVYFLHMSPKVEGGQNLLALIFTLIIVLIVLSGSMWVMFHLNQNMMPMPATMDGMG